MRNRIRFPLPLNEEALRVALPDFVHRVELRLLASQALALMATTEARMICLYAESFSYEEAAAEAGKSVEEVKGLVSSGRQKASVLCDYSRYGF